MTGYKQRFMSLSLLFLIFMLPFLGADTSTEKKSGLSFEKEGEDPVIRFEDENLFAYFQREDKGLTVDGTEGIPFDKLLQGGEVSLGFHLKNTSAHNAGKPIELKPCEVTLKLTKDPLYWRFVTGNKSVGVGNFKVKSPEKFRKLLPEDISNFRAEYRILSRAKDVQETLLVMKRKEADVSAGEKMEAGTGKAEPGKADSGMGKEKPWAGKDKPGTGTEYKLTLSSLPPELNRMGYGAGKGELIGRLELMADYDFQVPLVLKGEERYEYVPVIQGKLTLVIWRDVYND